MVLQPDGKILLGGQTDKAGTVDQLVVRLLDPQGTLDPSYGQGTGGSRLNFGGADRTGAIALQPDGRIIVAGSAGTTANTSTDVTILRLLNPEGTLDLSSFGGGTGFRKFDLGGNDSTAAVALQADGRIVTGGTVQTGTSTTDMTVTRRLANGDPDTGYGLGSGSSRLDFGAAQGATSAQDTAEDIALQLDGRIVIVGSTNARTGTNSREGAVSRLVVPDGTFDPSFGAGTGRLFRTPGSGSTEVKAVAVQPDGMIVVAGTHTSGATSEVVVFRLKPSGDPDPTFSDDGKASSGAGGKDAAEALVLQPNGKIVLAGSTGAVGAPRDALVMRLQPNGLPMRPSAPPAGPSSTSAATTARTLSRSGPTAGSSWQARPSRESPATSSRRACRATRPRDRAPAPAAVPAEARAPRPSAPASATTIMGSAGRDRLKGTRKADVIAGLGGNDTVNGLAGNDIVCGGAGADKLTGGAGADHLLGDAGADILTGGAGADTLTGGVGADKLLGGAGRDKLLGGAGADKLLGGAGVNILTGGPGKNVRTRSPGGAGSPGRSVARISAWALR